MRDLLSVDRFANQIRLRRSTYEGTFLLVEGSSDKTFYERFVNKSACQLVIISDKHSNKKCVINVLEILEKDSNFQGVIAIVDADFDRLTILPYISSNLLYTDSHDLETMLINSPAFDKVISEFGSQEKINQLNGDIKSVIVESSVSVGYLRWISQCNDLNLTFNGIIFNKFIDDKTLQIDELKLICEVKNKSQAFKFKDEDLLQQIINKRNNTDDHWQVCCGHDIVEIISLGLRKAIGSNKATDVEPYSLERNLRLAYEEIYFYETQLYLSISEWEKNNQPFKVLLNLR